MGEVLAAQADIEYLEGQVQEIAVPEASMAPVAQDTMDDTEFDLRLEHIEVESAEDEAAFEAAPPAQEDTGPEDQPPLSSPVQDLSNPALDKPRASAFPATAPDDIARNYSADSPPAWKPPAGTRSALPQPGSAPWPTAGRRDDSPRTTARKSSTGTRTRQPPRPADATASTPPLIPAARTGRPDFAINPGLGLRPVQAATVTVEAPTGTENRARLSHRLQEAWDSTQAVGVPSARR